LFQRFTYILQRAIIFLLLLSVAPAAAQDVVFNHVLSAPQYTNPALAGTFGLYHTSVAVRSQFTASGHSHNTIYAEADTYDVPWARGLGLFIMNDRSSGGVFQTTTMGLSYSYAFRIVSDIELRPALQAMFYLQHSNPRGLTFPDMLGSGGAVDPPDLYRQTNRQRVDFATGLVMQHPILQVGVAVQHFAAMASENEAPSYGDYALKITALAQAGIPLIGSGKILELRQWTAFDNIVLLPQAKYIHQRGFNYLIANLSVRAGGLFAGVALKTTFAEQTYIGMVTIGLMSQSLRAGYSFDLVASGGSLRGWNSGSHELFLHYSFGDFENDFRRREKKFKGRYLNPLCGCPY